MVVNRNSVVYVVMLSSCGVSCVYGVLLISVLCSVIVNWLVGRNVSLVFSYVGVLCIGIVRLLKNSSG